MSIVTPVVIVVLVAALLRNISPPSSPDCCITLNFELGIFATNKSPLTPMPPLTTRAADDTPVAAVVFVTLTVPPINALPPNPKPPAFINDPDVVEVELVVAVIANPGVDIINVEGLYESVVFEETATPEPVATGLKCKK